MSDNPAGIRINLPVENWLDIISHIPRQQLANQLAVVDRQFAAIAQRWLDHGKITLQRLFLLSELQSGGQRQQDDKPCAGDGAVVLQNKCRQIVPFPGDVPIPTNIVDFEELMIGDLNGQKEKPEVGEMLEKMKSLLSNVSIWLCYGKDERRDDSLCGKLLPMIFPMLAQIWPSIDGIKCVRTFGIEDVLGHEHILANVPMVYLECPLEGDGDTLDATMDWLLNRGKFESSNGQEDGKQERRMLMLDYIWPGFLEAIYEQFDRATSPASFFIRIKWVWDIAENIEKRNLRTGEVMKVEEIIAADNEDGARQQGAPSTWLIHRHPINAEQKEEEEAIGWKWEALKRRVVFRPGYICEL